MIKVALVDDHQLFRKSLSLLISTFDGMQVSYDTDNGLAFLDVAKNTFFICFSCKIYYADTF